MVNLGCSHLTCTSKFWLEASCGHTVQHNTEKYHIFMSQLYLLFLRTSTSFEHNTWTVHTANKVHWRNFGNFVSFLCLYGVYRPGVFLGGIVFGFQVINFFWQVNF